MAAITTATDAGNSGLYKAGETKSLWCITNDAAAASTSGSTYDGWGHLWNGEGCTSTDLVAMGLSETG
ncbi:hypothetical protein O9992_24850 [Vibrio lentus]|nr:hypothetical protein [Vibrio lentus]